MRRNAFAFELPEIYGGSISRSAKIIRACEALLRTAESEAVASSAVVRLLLRWQPARLDVESIALAVFNHARAMPTSPAISLRTASFDCRLCGLDGSRWNHGRGCARSYLHAHPRELAAAIEASYSGDEVIAIEVMCLSLAGVRADGPRCRIGRGAAA